MDLTCALQSPSTFCVHNTSPQILPSSPGLVRINSLIKAHKESEVGPIIRDANGLVVVALSKKIRAPLGPLEVEAKVFEIGLQFAKEVGYKSLHWKMTLLMSFVPLLVFLHLHLW